MRVAAIESRVLGVSARTNWYFVRVRTDTGITGVGEASLNGYERLLDACLAELVPRLAGASLDDAHPLLATYPHAPAHHIHHLGSRIPNYNLPRAYRENPIFHVQPLTLCSSLRCLKWRVYDEANGRLAGWEVLKLYRQKSTMA